MSVIEYVVRDVSGASRRGGFPEGDPSTIYVSYTKDVSLNLGQAEIASYARSGNDLVITLTNGETLALSGYFDVGSTGEKNLFLSQEGEIVEVVLDGANEGTIVAQYADVPLGEKWSPYDQLVFLDLAEVEPVVAPLAAPLASSLGGLAAGGAALVGGAVLASGGGGGGDNGDGDFNNTVIQPTVDDPDATYLVGGTADDSATVSGTGAPGSTVVVTVGDQTQTVTVDDGGIWTTTFEMSDLPVDGVYSATVSVADPDGNQFNLSGPTVDIDTTAPTVTVVSGTESTGDLVNAADHTNGATITGTGEARATVEVMIDGTTHTTTVDSTGKWSVTFAASEVATGEYSTGVTIVTTDARGNSSTSTDALVVDTVAPTTTLDAVETDNVISKSEASDGVTLSGTGEPGASVSVEFQGLTRTTTVADDGTWSVDYTSTEIAAGTYDTSVGITSTDAAGNTSVASHQVRVDTEQELTMDARVGGDYTINADEQSAGVTFTGTSEPGSTVVVTLGTVSHTVTAEPDGTWSADFAASDIPTGTYDTTVTAVATDAAGNTETTSSNVHVDTENAVTIAANQAGGDDIVNAAEAQAGVTFTGTAEPGSTVEVTVAGLTRTATVDASGNWSALYGGGVLPLGEYDTTISVTSTDAAGNVASTSSALRIDTTAGTVALSPNPIEIDDVINAVER